jgi:DNA primase
LIEKKKRGKLVLPSSLEPLGKKHQKYLEKRGFNLNELDKLWGINRCTTIAIDLPWRIFIPIYLHGELVSWTTRSLVNTGQRYISAAPEQEAINHKELLYGEDYCRNTIIVCEGPTDAWSIGPGAVATFGTAYTEAQVQRMSKYENIVICYDNESAAQRQAKKLMGDLSVLTSNVWNVVLKDKDPGSSTEIQELRKRFLS